MGDLILGLLGAALIVIVIIFIIAIVMYIVNGIALQRMANKLGVENSWLAWLPVANGFLLGKVAGDSIRLFSLDIPYMSIILLSPVVVIPLVNGITFIGPLVTLAYLILKIATTYKVYTIFSPRSATAFTVLGVIFPFLNPFFMLSASGNYPNIQQQQQPYYGAQPQPQEWKE